LMHQDLNVYSMAQLVRFFLGWFLDFVRVYGEDALDELDKLFNNWKVKIEKKRFSQKEMRQLWNLIYQKSGIYRLLNIYTNHFSPARIYRL
ncbi:MAG: hypothetical protein JXJ04_20845, partial [Spirochaetales bacterium]|nr:hypothetical protein [Spirochaetales bacterium]